MKQRTMGAWTARCASGLLALACATAVSPANAQQYPSRPIRFFVPGATGGPTDLIARPLADKVSASLKTPVIIENMAGRFIALSSLSRSAPDGHSIAVTPLGPFVIDPLLSTDVPFDPEKDITPFFMTVRYPYMLVVNEKKAPARTVQEFAKLAKSEPKGLFYGSVGSGSTSHVGMEILLKHLDIQLTHVPYKGQPPVIIALLAGEIAAFMATPEAVKSHLGKGQIKALAVAADKRIPALPDVMTFAETGAGNFELSSWFGVSTRAGVSKEIVSKLHQEFSNAMTPEMRQRMTSAGGQVGSGSPEEVASFVRSERVKWAAALKTLDIQK